MGDSESAPPGVPITTNITVGEPSEPLRVCLRRPTTNLFLGANPMKGPEGQQVCIVVTDEPLDIGTTDILSRSYTPSLMDPLVFGDESYCTLCHCTFPLMSRAQIRVHLAACMYADKTTGVIDPPFLCPVCGHTFHQWVIYLAHEHACNQAQNDYLLGCSETEWPPSRSPSPCGVVITSGRIVEQRDVAIGSSPPVSAEAEVVDNDAAMKHKVGPLRVKKLVLKRSRHRSKAWKVSRFIPRQ